MTIRQHYLTARFLAIIIYIRIDFLSLVQSGENFDVVYYKLQRKLRLPEHTFPLIHKHHPSQPAPLTHQSIDIQYPALLARDDREGREVKTHVVAVGLGQLVGQVLAQVLSLATLKLGAGQSRAGESKQNSIESTCHVWQAVLGVDEGLHRCVRTSPQRMPLDQRLENWTLVHQALLSLPQQHWSAPVIMIGRLRHH